MNRKNMENVLKRKKRKENTIVIFFIFISFYVGLDRKKVRKYNKWREFLKMSSSSCGYENV